MNSSKFLNELRTVHEEYHPQGLVVVQITDLMRMSARHEYDVSRADLVCPFVEPCDSEPRYHVKQLISLVVRMERCRTTSLKGLLNKN